MRVTGLVAITGLATLLLAASDTPVESVIGPTYADAPEMAVSPALPKGTLHAFVMRSEDSRIYPGIRQLQNDVTARRDAWGNRIAAPEAQQSEPAPYRREVFVYVPAGYRPGTPLPFMVVQDGAGYAARVALALDGLIARHRVPAMAAILIQSGGGDAQGSERGLEYDTVSGRYAEFVETRCCQGSSATIISRSGGTRWAARRWARAQAPPRPSRWRGSTPNGTGACSVTRAPSSTSSRPPIRRRPRAPGTITRI
jgi:hypothetical protein